MQNRGISLNKACPKDSFPIPHIDRLVEATAGNELLTFMDAFSGYNQIKMHPDDREKTAFQAERGIYCYKDMPFGLKNARATYQRLVNKIFAAQLGKTMEVYIDDMLVKSLKKKDHVMHLRECFEQLNSYNMKLNPTKCRFAVTSGEFLGYLVTQRGIEANPKQIQALIIEHPSIDVDEPETLMTIVESGPDNNGETNCNQPAEMDIDDSTEYGCDKNWLEPIRLYIADGETPTDKWRLAS